MFCTNQLISNIYYSNVSFYNICNVQMQISLEQLLKDCLYKYQRSCTKLNRPKKMDDTSNKANNGSLDTSHLLLIVILSSDSFLVIIVIVVCRRSGQSKKREESIRKRKSTASQGRASTSYHEIDEFHLSPDILFQRQSNGGSYIDLDQTKVEKSKYTTLPQVPNQ